VRAARALQAHTGTPLGANIVLEKRIPAQAGMGGGSSDAASCLLALNRLWHLELGLRELSAIGLKLGADIPFFLAGRNAWIEGVGEQITPIGLPAARFVVVKPPEGLETARIFGHPSLKRDTPSAIISGFAANPYGFGHNDLQPVAEQLCSGVPQALEWLGAQGMNPRMTGSGSAVFAQVLQDTKLAAAPASWQVRVCNNLGVHPLAGWAHSDDL
jgi:4-diphosphocytidyl-2-C-methyl-D-erythritol kinase